MATKSIQRKGSVKFVDKNKQLFFPVLKQRIDAYFSEEEFVKQGNHGCL